MYPQFPGISWITPYGLALVAGLLVAWAWSRKRAAAAGLDASHVDLIVPLGFLLSAFGAALFAWLVPADASWAGDAASMPGRKRLSTMLLTIGVVIFVYGRFAHLPLRRFADVFALPFLLCIAIGRIGCLLAGCCWGDIVDPAQLGALVHTDLGNQVNTLAWFGGEAFPLAIHYPAGSFAWQQQLVLGLIDSDAPQSLAVHPAPLYESAALLLLLAGLGAAEKGLRQPGQLALLTMVAYALIAIVMDLVRADNAAIFGPLTFTHVICVVILAAALPLGKRVFQPVS